MLQIVEQTDEQKRKMYSKLSKKELIEMLISANKAIDCLTKAPKMSYPDYLTPPFITTTNPIHPETITSSTSTEMIDNVGLTIK